MPPETLSSARSLRLVERPRLFSSRISAFEDAANMSVATQEKRPGLADRYLLGTPRIQPHPNPIISRGAYLGIPRRVPCVSVGQGGGSADSSTANNEHHAFGEERSIGQDSVAKSNLPLADTFEARKRKADRDAHIGRECTQARQEEGHIHPSSRINEEPITDRRNQVVTNKVLHFQDKENVNPLSDHGVQEPKKQISDRSQEKRPLQASKTSQNVPGRRKVGSLLVKQSIKVKGQKPTEGSMESSFPQNVLIERKQIHRIDFGIHNIQSTAEPMSCVGSHDLPDSDMYVHGDSMRNLQMSQTGHNGSASSRSQVVSPALQEQNSENSSSLRVCHSELQAINGKSALPESNQRLVAATLVKDLSSSMSSLAICDSPQANGKDLLILSKSVPGFSITDERMHVENFNPSAVACPSVLALSVPSASAWSYTIRTASAPPPTSHTVESLEPLNQQSRQNSTKDNSIPGSQASDTNTAPNEVLGDAKQVERSSLARSVIVENEVLKSKEQGSSHDNQPMVDGGLGKTLPHVYSQENKCTGVEFGVQPRKQGENEHFVWVNRRRYQKLKKIGRGGSSEVYKVIDRDGNIYALKRIKLKGRDYATASGFYQEIELLTKLQGKSYIIRLIDHEVTDKSLFSSLQFEPSDIVRHDVYIYMVLEYGEVDLATMLQEKFKERLPGDNVDETWLRFYWRQILEAVNTVHEERIIHADLKPANFLLVKGVLKLIDFGIAKSILGDTTNIQRDAQVGTLNYMSPEAFLMNEKDEHGNVIKCGRPSDIWALGCILYQMVYGKTPFAHITALHSRIQEVASPNHKINFPPVSNPHLLDIMKKCLAYKREDRLKIPELLNHPFIQPQVTQTMSTENCYYSTGLDDVKSLARLLMRRIESQLEAGKLQNNHPSAFARLLEHIRLFEKQMGEAD